MTQIITKAMLEQQIDRLNKITGQPPEPYAICTGDSLDKLSPQPGNYHLSCSNGGVCVEQMRENGGTDQITNYHDTKRNTYEKLCMYIKGIIEGLNHDK